MEEPGGLQSMGSLRVRHDFTVTFHFSALWSEKMLGMISILFEFTKARFMAPEKAMAPHSSTLAWKIPWTEEPWGHEESND